MRTETRDGEQHPTRPRLGLFNAFTRWLLHTRVLRRLVERHVCELRYTGVRSGRQVVLPVMYAQHDERIVVMVGRADHKRWWRNFTRPHPVRVWLRGGARTGVAHVVAADATGRADAAAIYAARFTKHAVHDDPMVVIALDPVP
jgi:hypothetical protein